MSTLQTKFLFYEISDGQPELVGRATSVREGEEEGDF
jgi:hypothetical protein